MRPLIWTLVFLTVGMCWAEVNFERDVQPIFAKRCLACHGPEEQVSGLRLDSPEANLKGSDSGPVVVPNSSGTSELMQRVSSKNKDFVMPPAGHPLTAAEIAAIRDWIDNGAKIPKTSSRKESNTKE